MRFFVTLLLLVACSSFAAAQAPRPAGYRQPACSAGSCPRPAQPVRTVTAARPAYQPSVPPVVCDPYGFTAWLNATRASYGLAAVSYDPNLAACAAVNNQHQAARGMGHYYFGSARRQNSAMGHYATIGAMWMQSTPHRSALLDPSIRFIGIAGLGTYWTWNGR